MRLTKQDFRQYLEERPDKVFYTRSGSMCPIAQAVRDLNPRVTAVVVGSYISWRLGKGMDHAVRATRWQRDFITDVDRQPGTITGQGALAVLDGVAA